MVKIVHKKLEEHKVAVRNVRREVHDKLRAMEKDKSARPLMRCAEPTSGCRRSPTG